MYVVSLKLNDEKNMTSFIYGVRSKKAARVKWFETHLLMARKNGLRGPKKSLLKSLELSITEK
jgi:hypothetical protein